MSETSTQPLDRSGFFALTDRHRQIIRLDDLALVRVTGKDAVTFLHGQFTNAVKGLGTRTVAAGYCSPKGRLLATFRLWMEEDAVMMMLPKAVEPALLKRLRLYVLRADVTFENITASRTVFGLLNTAQSALKNVGLELPAVGETFRRDGSLVLGLSATGAIDGLIEAAPRAIVVTDNADLFPSEAIAPNSALWWLGNIAAGVATVWPATREIFVPQAVNYELTGGVVFNKGCYPGQEVVSRVQHIGDSPRRAFIGWAEGDRDVLPGETIWSGGREVGFAIEAVRVDDKTLVLFSAALAGASEGFSLAPDGSKISLLPLPYEIRNILNHA